MIDNQTQVGGWCFAPTNKLEHYIPIKSIMVNDLVDFVDNEHAKDSNNPPTLIGVGH